MTAAKDNKPAAKPAAKTTAAKEIKDVEPRKGTARTYLEQRREELVTELDNLTGSITEHRQHADEQEALYNERRTHLADVDNALKVLQENDG